MELKKRKTNIGDLFTNFSQNQKGCITSKVVLNTNGEKELEILEDTLLI